MLNMNIVYNNIIFVQRRYKIKKKEKVSSRIQIILIFSQMFCTMIFNHFLRKMSPRLIGIF